MQKRKAAIWGLSVICLLVLWGSALYMQRIDTVSVPVLYITLDTDDALTDVQYSEASLKLTYPAQISNDSISITVRYRGNSTYNKDKKSYKIKLDEKMDLLTGAGSVSDDAARDWVLLANIMDATMLCNYFSLTAAQGFSGLAFVPECMFVEVYFQGEYQGIYLMCEDIEVNEARLDIDDQGNGDVAVLLEMCKYLDQDYSFEVDYGGETLSFDVCSDIANEAQVERAIDAITAVNEAILSGDQAAISAVIDLESCIDMYLVHEFTKNVDVGWGSFYVYLEADDDTLYFGPPWDFDRCMSQDARSADYAGLYAAGEADEERVYINHWYVDLMQLDWFQDMVQERWNEKKDVFLETLEEMAALEETYRTLFQQDYLYWRVDASTADDVWQQVYLQEYQTLYDWIAGRYDWMDYYLNDVL